MAGGVVDFGSIRADVVPNLDAIGAEAWNRLARRATLYQSHQWLRFVEDDVAAEGSYLVVRSGKGDLLGALPVYRVANEANTFYQPGHLFGDLWQGDERELLYAGTRRGYHSCLLVEPTLVPAAAASVVSLLLEELSAATNSRNAAAALLMYVTSESRTAILRHLPDTRSYLTAADSHLELVWSSFAEFLATRSRNRRQSLRREMRAFEEADYEVGVETLQSCWEEAGRLLALTQQRYGHKSSEEGMQALVGAQMHLMNDLSLVFTCRVAGDLVAFSLFYEWLGVLYLRMVGFDYGRLRSAYEYFNLAYYLPLQYAYAHQLRFLHLGIEAHEAKARRGAMLRPLWTLVVPPLVGEPSLEDVGAWNRAKGARLKEELGPFGKEALTHPEWTSLLGAVEARSGTVE